MGHGGSPSDISPLAADRRRKGWTRDLHSAIRRCPISFTMLAGDARRLRLDARVAAGRLLALLPFGHCRRGSCGGILQMTLQGVITDAEHPRGLTPAPPAAFDHEPRITRRPRAHGVVPLERWDDNRREIPPEEIGRAHV